MLNRTILLAMLIACMLIVSTPLKAELVYIDQGIVYETLGDQYWYQDLSVFINKNYYEQMEAVTDLGGNWRMANEDDIYNLWAYNSMEIGEAFTPSYLVINPYNSTVSTGWRGRANYIFTDNTINGFSHATPNIWKENDIWHEKIIFGSYPDTVSEFLGAWVVTDICPLTDLELANSLYRKIEESTISNNLKRSYLNIVKQIVDSIQKDKINNGLIKMEALSIEIQEDIDNGSIDAKTGSSFLAALNIIRLNI